MRINWFSPLPGQRTDIAHFTMRLAAALMSRFDVTFWTDLDHDPGALPEGAKIRRFGDGGISDRDLRAGLDDGINVFNLGNDARFHGGIADLAARVPGMPVFHDFRLHHFVFERARHDPEPFARYVRDAEDLYGTIGRVRAEEVIGSDGAIIDWFVERLPFTGLFTRRAFAAICHSQAAAAALRSDGLPTVQLALPFDAPPPCGDAHRAWGPPWRLVVYGYMNPNRRLESILAALSNWRHGSEFTLDIYGSLWDDELVRRLIQEGAFAGRVRMHGFVPEDELNGAISGAHLTFHLRHPTMGETSGGILRSWALATPTLVTTDGWFATLPDNVTFKIPVEDEIDHIRRVLADLTTHPEIFRAVGVAGRDYLATNHSSKAYVDGLYASLAELPKWKLRWIRNSLDEDAREFAGSLGAARSGPAAVEMCNAVVERVRRHVNALWPSRRSVGKP